MNEFLTRRSQELNTYRDHPILIFLRKIKKTNPRAFDAILFYFGEMIMEVEYQECCSVWWIHDSHIYDDFIIIEKAFRIVCPSCTITKKYNVVDDPSVISFQIKWPTPKDMAVIVYNKWIFPDFSPIEKKNLSF